ncbi:hypothetical protein AMS68_003321 [Peltaster fructicola]|uniref:Uncharacterized protein n=1 Tax=Peltaster fructicola TaxID=286661 RepID=A0A6H0XSU1_9PEZI|nr:hypothetical protein AMS68_003321 [Peltaster fructicola]
MDLPSGQGASNELANQSQISESSQAAVSRAGAGQRFQELLKAIVATGQLEGAPDAHRRVADYVEYIQAIVNTTISVAEAITSTDLRYFAMGLPTFTHQGPSDLQLTVRDIRNLACFQSLLPPAVESKGPYFVSSTYHTAKIKLIMSSFPRACEWLIIAAILTQRGLGDKVVRLLRRRKVHFIEAMRDGIQKGAKGVNPALIAYDATLDRVIVSVVTSLKSLQLGVLGGELAIDGDLPDHLDFDYYVTGDPVIHQVVQEAQALGIQFQDDGRLIQPGHTGMHKRLKRSTDLGLPSSSSSSSNQLQRVEILSTATGSCRYHIINNGPTGRVPHERLVFGLVNRLFSKLTAPGLQTRFTAALSLPTSIRYNLEVDLESGVAEILVNDQKAKGQLDYPALSIDPYLDAAADVQVIPDIMHELKSYMIEFLDFSRPIPSTTADWNRIALTYLVVKGWWWSRQLINAYPSQLYVPSHSHYFHAMASIGAIMMHLEQGTGCSITSNMLLAALRLLTNIGSTNESVSGEALTYAAQGPGGTIVHDILSASHPGWSSNPYLSFQWLNGKFTGVPETAMFGQSPEHLIEAPIPSLAREVDLQDDSEPSLTIFADATDGHTLRCAVVDTSRSIRSVAFSRALCGLLLSYIGTSTDCQHAAPEPDSLIGRQVLSVPWSTLLKHYYGQAELPEADVVVVIGIEQSKLCQILALGCSSLGTTIDAQGCTYCAFERSAHVVRLSEGGIAGSVPFVFT